MHLCFARGEISVDQFLKTRQNILVHLSSGDELPVIEQRTVTISKIFLKVLDMWELCINFAAVKQFRR